MAFSNEGGGKPDISTPAMEYNRLASRWDMIEALRNGTEAMRRAGDKYLPRFEKETIKNYDRRRRQSVLFDGLDQTIKDLVGLPFSKAITLNDDVPRKIKQLAEDIDRNTTELTPFAREVFDEGLAKGTSHILVDMDPKPEVRTGTRVDDRGRRPYWLHIRPENLIDARQERVGDFNYYVDVRIREDAVEYKGFEEKLVRRIRRINAIDHVWQLWRETEDKRGKRWELEADGDYDLDFVTLATFFAGKRLGNFTAKPPLENLAFLNVALWQSQSDQQNILRAARFAILAMTGAKQNEIELGPTTVISLPLNAKLEYVEHSGAAIQAGERDIQMRKDEMAAAGSSLLVKRPGVVSATEKSIDEAKEQSELQAIAQGFNNTINTALFYTAQWLGEDKGGTATVFDDFGINKAPDRVLEAVKFFRQTGDLGREDAWTLLKNAGIFPDNFDIKSALERSPDLLTAGFDRGEADE